MYIKHDGLKLYRSVFGAVITIALVCLLMLYTVYKYNALIHYNDTNIMSSVYENYYTDENVFKGGKNGVNVAFGLIAYESDSDKGFSQYGEIKAKLKTWGEQSIIFEELAHRPCTKEDLGLSDDQN